MQIRVLIACEFSGTVRRAFNALPGFDAYSCDVLESEDKSSKHIQCDVREILGDGWDLMIAHPPCTYLSNSGVRWLHTKPGRFDKMEAGARFFRLLLDSQIEHVAIENPVIHKYAASIIGRRQDQSVQPWQFGHGECKRTCFWLVNLPLLVSTDVVGGREKKVHRMPPSAERWKLRSLTYPGIARAMATQWGAYVHSAN